MVGGLVSEPVPVTPLAELYFKLHFEGAGKEGMKAYEQRRKRAQRFLDDDGRELATLFHRSLDLADKYFGKSPQNVAFHPKRLELKSEPGLNSTAALGRWLTERKSQRWEVLGDSALDFYYLDRELVSTHAPGAKLGPKKKRTSDGPRLDLLLANADPNIRRPIIGEVKLTTGAKSTADGGLRGGSPDKDPFFALVQALASAAYILPPSQMARLKQLGESKRIDTASRQVDLYILVSDAPERSPIWFELRDQAERLGEVLLPQINDHVSTIAGLDLAWFPHRPKPTRLRISKRFAYRAP